MTAAARNEMKDARDTIKAELEELAEEERAAVEEIRELKATIAAIRERRAWRKEQLQFVRTELAK